MNANDTRDTASKKKKMWHKAKWLTDKSDFYLNRLNSSLSVSLTSHSPHVCLLLVKGEAQ